jgi:hypothetical protein
MAITRPYRRTCRQFTNGSYSDSGKWMYVLHNKFAKSPEHFIRAFLLLQKDLHELFDYIEPSDKNCGCYSFRIHEMLMRICMEVEANCKAILFENGYSKSGDLNMNDYNKIELSHRLSSYKVKLPVWHGNGGVRQPFAAWSSGGSLSWYQAYNHTKHDRYGKFQEATFENMLDAMCGLVALLSSQFITEDFGPGNAYLCLEGNGRHDGMESAIGGYFRVKFPDDWPVSERYNFEWQTLRNEPDPFQNFNYA